MSVSALVFWHFLLDPLFWPPVLPSWFNLCSSNTTWLLHHLLLLLLLWFWPNNFEKCYSREQILKCLPFNILCNIFNFSSSTQQQAVASFMASTLKRDSSQFINSLLVYKITSHTFSPTFNADENMWKIVPTPTHTYKSIYINVCLNSIHLWTHVNSTFVWNIDIFLKIHPCSPPSLLQPDIANFLIWTFHGLVSGNFENLRILLTRLFSSSCQKHKIIQATNSIFPNPFLFRAWWCVCCILKPCDSNTSLLCVCYALAHSCLQLSKHSKKFYRLKK